MGTLVDIASPLHKKTKRDYFARMADDKVACMIKSKEYEFDYWDGDRRYGYGGYRYDGRWKIVAERLIERYQIKDGAKILDVGCGKGHILHEFKLLLPNSIVSGFDISKHGIADSQETVRPHLFIHRAEEPYPFKDKEFDLVISINCLHNLKIFELERALKEIERVGKNKYVMAESYRNESELFNLQCWALTCEAFFRPEEWEWMFSRFGYTGDYEFIFME